METADFREQFPAMGAKVWLTTPSVGPAALPVLAALRAAVDGWEHGELDLRTWDTEAQSTRALFARVLGARRVADRVDDRRRAGGGDGRGAGAARSRRGAGGRQRHPVRERQPG